MFSRPACREAREISPSERGNGRGGSGCQNQSMNTNMSSPMTQASIGGYVRKVSGQTVPKSQGMEMGSQGYGSSGLAQSQNANQGYDAPTFTQSQAVPSPSMGQQFGDRAWSQEVRPSNQPVKNYPGRRGPLRQGGRGGGGSGSHPSQGGLKNIKQQGLSQPPTNELANMSSSEKDKAGKDKAELGNRARLGHLRVREALSGADHLDRKGRKSINPQGKEE
jgi:hypothetical protein